MNLELDIVASYSKVSQGVQGILDRVVEYEQGQLYGLQLSKVFPFHRGPQTVGHHCNIMVWDKNL